MNHNTPIIFYLLSIILLSCETRPARQGEQQENKIVTDLPTISIKPLAHAPEYPDAILEMLEPWNQVELNAADVKFLFDIKNFRLSNGNYIFMNLNNEHLFQSTSPEITASLKNGNYLSVSFLCMPNHVSLKNYGNYVVRSFTVGKASLVSFDDTLPMIFYNYPSGRIKDETNGSVMLDFYLINTVLAINGHAVKMELADREFVINSWQPHLIEGLEKGEYKVKLTLLDKNENIVTSPFNPATGSFVLY